MGKRTQKLMLKDLAKKTLNLGYVGENDHTQIIIDCSEVFWDYPNAVPVLNVQPPRGDKYPATQITKDGDDLIWTISDSDIIYAGNGRIQLKFTNNGEIVKSAVGSTKIDGSIETTGDAPAPLEDWMDRAEETAEQIAENAASTVLENYDELVDDVSSLKSAFEQFNDNVITESAGPASIVSIVDGADGMPMRKVEVAIEPVQDLHGYDAPWPGGGGKNKFPYDSIPSGSGTILNKQPVNIPAGQYTLSCVREIVNAGNVVFTFYDSNDQTVGTATMYMSNTMSPTFTLTGNAASVTAYANANVYLTHIQMEEGTTKTDFVPYSNICPISGWTGAKVTRTGKNLIKFPYHNADGIYSGVQFATDSDGKINASGTASSGVNFILTVNNYYKSGRYTLSIDGTHEGIDLLVWDYTKNALIGRINSTQSYTPIVLEQDANLQIYFNRSSGGVAVNVSAYVQFELGSTVTDYESYRGQTYEVTFPTEAGTVYGGTLDVVSGKLVVDRVIATISDLSVNINFNVGTYTVMKRFFLKIPSNSGIPYNKLHGAIASFGVEGEAYYGSQRNNDLGSLKVNYAITGSGESLAIYDTDLSLTDTTFMEKYGSQQVCYPLASPIEYTLTPQEIKTLLGTNHIWADTGDTEVTYPADTKLYIDRKITEAVANALNA